MLNQKWLNMPDRGYMPKHEFSYTTQCTRYDDSFFTCGCCGDYKGEQQLRVVMRYEGTELIVREQVLNTIVSVDSHLTATEKAQIKVASTVLYASFFLFAPCMNVCICCISSWFNNEVKAIRNRAFERILPELYQQADQEVDRRIAERHASTAPAAGRITMNSDGSITGDPQAIAALLAQSMGRSGILNGVQRPIPVEGIGVSQPTDTTPLLPKTS